MTDLSRRYRTSVAKNRSSVALRKVNGVDRKASEKAGRRRKTHGSKGVLC